MNLPKKVFRAIMGLIWAVYYRFKREEIEKARQEEELRQRRKREDDAAFDERNSKKKYNRSWEEKLEKAYSECSSYGKSHKTSYKRHYRRKSSH